MRIARPWSLELAYTRNDGGFIVKRPGEMATFMPPAYWTGAGSLAKLNAGIDCKISVLRNQPTGWVYCLSGISNCPMTHSALLSRLAAVLTICWLEVVNLT